ncbi:MliC family protein [Roseibium aggregatum]|uniref:MliC family protein n=1 Tax=Roseibium aggregatum TaxID=187304 RepID=A0A939EAZ6_9HYPH|nr:MliC family protein [Roseibium aggregatum]MBN9669618.1 MliC family protein [Roseibium aggregatum]
MNIAVLAATLCGPALPAVAQSADGAQWQQSGYDDENGGRSYTLTYGIPETDAWALNAFCEARAKGPGIPLMLALNFGARNNGDVVEVIFSTGAYQTVFSGTVSIQSDEYAGVEVMIGVEDPFWNALGQGDALLYGLPGEEMRSVPLRGANAPVRSFLDHCQQTFAATDAATPPAPEGPFTYNCDDGSHFYLTFDNSQSTSVATISLGSNSATLVQAPSASGTLYKFGALEMHTKGDEAMIVTPQDTVRCMRQR